MKKSLSIALAASVLALCILPAGASPADAGLSLSCASCLLMEKETGAVLLEDNAHEKL